MLSSKVLHMGIQKTLYQKPYELQVDSLELDADFEGCERQFYRLKISLVYDKSDKDTTIYDSCNAECATRMMQNMELFNISDAYSTTYTILHLQRYSTLTTILRNICSGNNILPGIATAIQTLPLWITSITLYFRSFYLKKCTYPIPLMKEFI